MKNRIKINGKLYEAVSNTDNYLPDRDEIIEDINDAVDDLKDSYNKYLSPSAKKNRELKDLFAKATLSLVELKDYLRKNYSTIEHY